MVVWPQRRRVVSRPSFQFFFLSIWWAFAYIAQPDSPRMAVPVGAGVRMPGSFGFGFDDDEAELDELVLRVRKLGVKGKE
jgi:hypothetical protein